jgi:rod shape-determining protein MreD
VRPILDAGWFRYLLVMSVVWALQMAVVPDTTVAGIKADLMVLFVIGAAAQRGADTGAMCGFFVGITYDALLTTPFGLSALTYTAIGWVVGGSQQRLLKASWWIPSFVAAVASAASVVFFSLSGRLFGLMNPSTAQVGRIALVVATINLVLAPAATRVCTWVFSNSQRRAVI